MSKDSNFTKGLLVGIGIGLAVSAVLFIMFFFTLFVRWNSEEGTTVSHGKGQPQEEVVHGLPPPRQHYHGSYGRVCGGSFLGIPVLAPGEGSIEGAAVVNGAPVTGLRLRLVLNGRAYTQWATTDQNGRYVVAVPFGEYTVNGFQLGADGIDRILAGKIDAPSIPCEIGPFKVGPDTPGEGLKLSFIDPVSLHDVKRRFTEQEDVTFRWEHYPGAVRYRIYLSRYLSGEGSVRTRSVFPAGASPLTEETHLSLRALGTPLSPGAYEVEIQALDERGTVISHSRRARFEITTPKG